MPTTLEALNAPRELERQRPLAPLIDAIRRWLHGLLAGRLGVLQVHGVDASYCDYRSTVFSERFEDLQHLAASIH